MEYLPRSLLDTYVKDDPEMFDVIHCIEIDLPISNSKLQQIKRMTEEDEIL